MQRYVKRVIGIVDGEQAKKYAIENANEIWHKVMNLFNESKVLYKNYAPNRGQTLDYYVNKEILIIVDPKKDEIYTLYFITLDEEEYANSLKIQRFVKLIQKNNNSINAINVRQNKQERITSHIEYMLNRLKGELVPETLLNELQEERENSINICKELASDAKKLRLENREMMAEIFKKK